MPKHFRRLHPEASYAALHGADRLRKKSATASSPAAAAAVNPEPEVRVPFPIVHICMCDPMCRGFAPAGCLYCNTHATRAFFRISTQKAEAPGSQATKQRKRNYVCGLGQCADTEPTFHKLKTVEKHLVTEHGTCIAPTQYLKFSSNDEFVEWRKKIEDADQVRCVIDATFLSFCLSVCCSVCLSVCQSFYRVIIGTHHGVRTDSGSAFASVNTAPSTSCAVCGPSSTPCRVCSCVCMPRYPCMDGVCDALRVCMVH